MKKIGLMLVLLGAFVHANFALANSAHSSKEVEANLVITQKREFKFHKLVDHSTDYQKVRCIEFRAKNAAYEMYKGTITLSTSEKIPFRIDDRRKDSHTDLCEVTKNNKSYMYLSGPDIFAIVEFENATWEDVLAGRHANLIVTSKDDPTERLSGLVLESNFIVEVLETDNYNSFSELGGDDGGHHSSLTSLQINRRKLKYKYRYSSWINFMK